MKVIAVLSGGMDSVVMLHLIRQENPKASIHAISFDYGQRHGKELEYAAYWGQKLAKEHIIVTLDFMRTLAGNSVLTGAGAIPEGHYEDASMKQTVVPARNMVMLAIATAWAENIKADKVYFGAHAGDHAIYPDCRPEFVNALCHASEAGTYQHVSICAPFIDMTKTQIAAYGQHFGVDFTKTWSCYKGGKKHCGKCGTCVERKEAFKLSEVKDPTDYEA